MNITLNTHVERDPAHVGAMTGAREVALMSVAQGAYYGLNEVATRIWELVEHAIALQDICAALQAEYEIETQRCEHDVTRFIEQLVREGLVRIVDA